MTNSILIIEDDIPFRDVLASTLGAEGYSVEVAAHGAEALELLKSRRFDLILSDIIMPEHDGLELLLTLRSTKNAPRIIAMTGSHPFTEIYMKTAQALGAARVLVKPFRRDELLAITREVLNS